MKKVTIKEVARAANVSYTTVSRALSNSTDIGGETKERILQKCRELGYPIPNTAPQTAKTIGLIVSSIVSSFTAETAFFVEEQARANGYDLILCNTQYNLEREVQAYRHLVERRVDGILFKQCYLKSYEAVAPYMGIVPTVFLNEDMGDLPVSYIAIDNRKAAYMGTEYLYSLGHRDILFFGRRDNKQSRIHRAAGYQQACQDFGLQPKFLDYHQKPLTHNYSYRLAKELFTRPMDYTAIFASSDAMAISIMEAAAERGIRIPEDLSLLGFDNNAFSALPNIKLTTIEQPKQASAAAAVTMLLDKIRYPTTPPVHKILLPALVIRDSCKKL